MMTQRKMASPLPNEATENNFSDIHNIISQSDIVENSIVDIDLSKNKIEFIDWENGIVKQLDRYKRIEFSEITKLHYNNQSEKTLAAGLYHLSQRRKVGLCYGKDKADNCRCSHYGNQRCNHHNTGKAPIREIHPHGASNAFDSYDKFKAAVENDPEAWFFYVPRADECILDGDNRNGFDEAFLTEVDGSPLERTPGGVHVLLSKQPEETLSTSGSGVEGVDLLAGNKLCISWPSPGYEWERSPDSAKARVPAQFVQRRSALSLSLSEPPVRNGSSLNPGTQLLIHEGAPKGRRSEAIGSVAFALFHARNANEHVFEVLTNPENGISEKPREKGDHWTRAEIERLRDKWRRETAQHHSDLSRDRREQLTPVAFGDIRLFTQNNWVIKSLLTEQGMSVLYGPSNVGKSFLALDMSLHVACGWQYRDRKVKLGYVMYLAAEGGRSTENRILGAKRYYETQLSNISHVPLDIIPCPVDLYSDDCDVNIIIQRVRERSAYFGHKPRLIIVDTLARAMGAGNENAPEDMGAFIKNVDRLKNETGAHVCVVHHPGKDESRGARGHSSLLCACDTELHVYEKGNAKIMEVTKQRDGETGIKLPFTLHTIELGRDDDNDSITTCIVVPAIELTLGGQLSRPKALIMDKARELANSDGVVQLKDLRAECCKLAISNSEKTSSKARVFNRNLNDLTASNHLRKLEGQDAVQLVS